MATYNQHTSGSKVSTSVGQELKKQITDQQQSELAAQKLDIFIGHVLRITEFLRECCVYQQTNHDVTNALTQLEVYSYLNDFCRKLIVTAKMGASIEGAWSLLHEILKVVDQGIPVSLCLPNRLFDHFTNWCELKKTQKQIGFTGVLGSPSRKRCHTEDNYYPIKNQCMAEPNDEVLPVTENQARPTMIGDGEKELLISEADEQLISTLITCPFDYLIGTKFKIPVYRHDLLTLLGSNWLNDTVINFYMELLIQRSMDFKGQLPSVYAFNTFFIHILLTNGYPKVRRWTRNIDIFSKQIIAVPVHHFVSPQHWSMAIIHLRDKAIRYYDSMGRRNQDLLEALMKYLEEESLDKRNMPFDTSDFRLVNVRNVPLQANGNDCGVFCCAYAEYVTRDVPLTFTQAHIPDIRKKMIVQIVNAAQQETV